MSYSSPGLLTDESRWLAKLVKMSRMSIHNSMMNRVQSSATFVIGDGGPNTPTNGATTYTNTSLIDTKPSFFLDGVGFLVLGTDYSFNATTGVITLLASTFVTSHRYVVLY